MEQFTDTPLQTIIKASPYFEYADSDDTTAFFNSLNSLGQQYLDWFNDTPLGVYTDPSISGPLLDWIANNLWGIYRPVISTSSTFVLAGYNSFAYNTLPYDSMNYIQSGTAQIATDDIYKRLLTWILYLGDGKQMSIQWLRRRIARFIYGADGGDIDIGLIANINIAIPSKSIVTGAWNSMSWDLLPWDGGGSVTATAKHALSISVPNNNGIGPIFADLVNGGYLPLPFQLSYEVNIS